MPLTVATYNVFNLIDGGDGASRSILPRKIETLARVLRECDADVIALQEIGSPALARVLVAAIGDGRYLEPTVGTGDGRGIRCAVVSRVPVRNAQVHTASSLSFPAFSTTDPPPFGARIPLRRGVPHLFVAAPGLGDVHIFCAHFKSRIGVSLRDAAGAELPAIAPRARSEALVRSLVWRAAEALHLRNLIDGALAATPGASALVAGDLNDVPESPVLGALRSDGPSELRDCTAHMDPVRRFSIIQNGRGMQIDHVLASQPLFQSLANARFLNAGIRDHGTFVPGVVEPASTESDHAPLVVRFD